MRGVKGWHNLFSSQVEKEGGRDGRARRVKDCEDWYLLSLPWCN